VARRAAQLHWIWRVYTGDGQGRQALPEAGLVVMNRQELRAAGSLAAVFSVRLLGLFMIYPVFEAYARDLSGATPYLIGEALGIYGLTQGLLQIPFGLLSDKLGRKVMIVFGLVLFGLGSAIAARSDAIGGVIVGRALQGAGAVGSVILALIADLTAEDNRTNAMALVGISIGVSFIVALVAGPIVAHLVGVPGIFWLMVVLAAIGIAITQFAVPSPPRLVRHRDAEAVPSLIGTVLTNRELLRLDVGIFALHAMLTASFLVVPGLIRDTLNVSARNDWMIYLPVLLVSVVVMLPAIVVAEKFRLVKGVFVLSVAALLASQMMLYLGATDARYLLGGLVVFFSAFNVMEAMLPSLVTRVAPPDAKGTAMGLYSSLQFLGIFAGGAAGGFAGQHAGSTGVFAVTAALALVWLLAAFGMAQPSYLTTRIVPTGEVNPGDAERLAGRLRKLPGVVEAVVVAEEKVAYLKVDAKTFDATTAAAVAGAA
jgi:MFS family permease